MHEQRTGAQRSERRRYFPCDQALFADAGQEDSSTAATFHGGCDETAHFGDLKLLRLKTFRDHLQSLALLVDDSIELVVLRGHGCHARWAADDLVVEAVDGSVNNRLIGSAEQHW